MDNWNNDEIRRRMVEKGVRNVDLANAMGLTPNKISKVWSGLRQWNVREMDIIRSMLAPEPTPTVEGGAVRAVPKIGRVAASNLKEALQRPLGHELLPAKGLPQNVIALEVDGDSMDLFAKDGDTVIVDLDDKALYPDKLYVVMNEQGEATFKQFRVDPARLVPCSSNPIHREMVIGAEPLHILGRVLKGVIDFN